LKSLLDSPAAAVLATYRKDGTKLSPVWFRHEGDYFEVVIAEDDIKVKHIRRNPRVTLLIFETVPPFRGVEVTDDADISSAELDASRRSISSRYLDEDASQAWTKARAGNGVVVRIPVRSARSWDLGHITAR
jgi:general stress protein 26